MSFVRYQLDLIRSPGAAIARLSEESAPALIGFKNVLFAACLYDLAIALWLVGGATVTAPAFLAIPADQYYIYEVFFFLEFRLNDR